MDPPTTNDTTAINTAPFSLSEIWSIPMNGATGAAVLARAGPFGPNLGRFMEPAPNREVSGSGEAPDAGVVRKRRENNAPQDDSAKSDSDGKRLKTSGSGDDNTNLKADDEATCEKGAEQKTRTPSEPHKDYIHVRARRGQATDSHSLAERARREKISERMRILQDLVPGCNKVIGKALVLDEIINYVQSLQHQVEFLSMKLEAVNSRMTPDLEGSSPKDFGQQAFDTSRMLYGSQTCESPREYGRGSSPEWLHMQLGGSFGRQT